MRKLFSGYYPPNFEVLWKDASFAFDANVLLNIYRYSADTRGKFFEILNRVKDRIWLPYQVAYEYQKNRVKVVADQQQAYKVVTASLDSALKELKSGLNRYSRHSVIDVQRMMATVEKAMKPIKDRLEKEGEKHEDLVFEDALRDKLTKLFEDKVGQPYSKEDLEKIYKEAANRYKQKIPPGYKDDKDKPEPDKYGDVVLWFQLKEYAK